MADEYVRFGDVFQLENLKSGAVVSVDVENKDPRAAENACAVSASFITDACARNTFTFEKYEPKAGSGQAERCTFHVSIPRVHSQPHTVFCLKPPLPPRLYSRRLLPSLASLF